MSGYDRNNEAYAFNAIFKAITLVIEFTGAAINSRLPFLFIQVSAQLVYLFQRFHRCLLRKWNTNNRAGKAREKKRRAKTRRSVAILNWRCAREASNREAQQA